jgi:outer membrane protein
MITNTRNDTQSSSINAIKLRAVGSMRGRPRTLRIVRSTGPLAVCVLVLPLLIAAPGRSQQTRPSVPPASNLTLAQPAASQSGPPLTITLQDALSRARANSPQFQAAVTAVKLARENRVQARASMLPSVDYTTQYLNTQGNGISPVGRFVTNDGVHVYRAWGVLHENMPSTFFISAGPRGAAYEEALARANEEIARRGLAVTVTTSYYALIVAQRKYATAQQGLEHARRFLQIAQELEHGGEVAHTDVIRFQLQFNQQEQVLQDAQVAMSDARLNLAVLLFPSFNENFTVVDDLDMPPVLPAFGDVRRMAENANPQIRAAVTAYRQAHLNVSVARAAFYPSFSIDFDYGIEANAFALYSNNETVINPVSGDRVRQPNLGYFATYTVNLPIWDWGARLSKLRQAKDQRQLARLDLTFAQRQLLSQLYSFYDGAQVACNQLDTLHDSVQLAAHNLQLVTMQYKAGETSVLGVLDAENSLNQARNAYATGEARYRNALATLQTLTGSF